MSVEETMAPGSPEIRPEINGVPMWNDTQVFYLSKKKTTTIKQFTYTLTSKVLQSKFNLSRSTKVIAAIFT